MVTRKWYTAIASTLRDIEDENVRVYDANTWIVALSADNPRFDAERFCLASGVLFRREWDGIHACVTEAVVA